MSWTDVDPTAGEHSSHHDRVTAEWMALSSVSVITNALRLRRHQA